MQVKTAIKIMLWLIAVITIFHLSILLQLVPYEITWGGRLKTDAEMYRFESVSLAMNLFLGWLLLIKGTFIKPIIPLKVVNIFLWLFLVLFAFNTVGNVLATTLLEKSFALLTLTFCILLWVILTKSKRQETPRKV